MTERPKTYLGDGCYLRWEGNVAVLATSNGIRDTNTIYMEPEVLVAFLAVIRRDFPEADAAARRQVG